MGHEANDTHMTRHEDYEHCMRRIITLVLIDQGLQNSSTPSLLKPDLDCLLKRRSDLSGICAGMVYEWQQPYWFIVRSTRVCLRYSRSLSSPSSSSLPSEAASRRAKTETFAYSADRNPQLDCKLQHWTSHISMGASSKKCNGGRSIHDFQHPLGTKAYCITATGIAALCLLLLFLLPFDLLALFAVFAHRLCKLLMVSTGDRRLLLGLTRGDRRPDQRYEERDNGHSEVDESRILRFAHARLAGSASSTHTTGSENEEFAQSDDVTVSLEFDDVGQSCSFITLYFSCVSAEASPLKHMSEGVKGWTRTDATRFMRTPFRSIALVKSNSHRSLLLAPGYTSPCCLVARRPLANLLGGIGAF